MRICIVGSSGVPIPPEYGGSVERHVYDLAKFLAKRNCTVHILTMKTGTTKKQEIIENIHVHRGGHYEHASGEDASTMRTLRKHATFFAYVLITLLRSETDLIHAHNGIPGLAALLAAKAKSVPFIFTNHTPYTSIHHKITGESAGLKRRFEDIQVALEKLCAKRASCVIATSRKVREGLRSIGVPEYRIFLVPNGVDVRQFRQASDQASRVREKFGLDKRTIVLYVGRIVRYKGLDYLVDAAIEIIEKHSDVKFVIVGPVSYYSSNVLTPYYQELRKKIESEKLSEHFVFTGAVDDKDLKGLYSACDMLVLPSLSEGFGMVLVEAMSCGKPVIGSRIDGILDVFNDGEGGFLVAPASPEEIASRIDSLIESPALRKAMGETAKKRVKEMFDWNILASHIMKIYLKAIKEKQG